MRNYIKATFFFAALAAAHSLPAQQEELRLTTMLHFDCAVSSETDPATSFQLGVSYIVYANDPKYQVNFEDPARVLFNRLGWAPEGEFALAHLTTDGRSFAWLGKRTEKMPVHEIEMTVQLAPATDGGDRSTLSLIRFVSDNSGSSRAESFKGECDRLSGRAAWERYQTGSAK